MRDKKYQFFILLALIAGLVLTTSSFARDLPQFADLAEQNAPSVVNISTRSTSSRSDVSPFNMPEFQGLPEGSPLG
ncbi:MAG: serine peptidase, partial [Candidatus Thiodiazotropha sp. 6PLUC5]